MEASCFFMVVCVHTQNYFSCLGFCVCSQWCSIWMYNISRCFKMVLKETKMEFSCNVNKTFNAAEGTISFPESYMQTLKGGVWFPCTVFIIYLWCFWTGFKDVRLGLVFQFFDKTEEEWSTCSSRSDWQERVSLSANTFINLPTLGLSAFSAKG